jgi:hypothetical protein
MGYLTRLLANSAGRIAGNYAYYGTLSKHSAQSVKYDKKAARIQSEKNQISKLGQTWVWFAKQINGRSFKFNVSDDEADSFNYQADLEKFNKDIVKVMNNWDPYKYNQSKLDSLSYRFEKLARQVKMFERVQRHLDSLPDSE